MKAVQEAIRYSFIKFCIYCFFPFRYEFLVHYALRVEKSINLILMRDLLEFKFLRPRACLTNPFRTLTLCFGVTGRTPDLLISRKYFVKKSLSASAIAIMSWQDATRSSLCSGVKQCGTKRAHNFLFPKSSFRIRRTTVLGMLQDSVYHS